MFGKATSNKETKLVTWACKNPLSLIQVDTLIGITWWSRVKLFVSKEQQTTVTVGVFSLFCFLPSGYAPLPHLFLHFPSYFPLLIISFSDHSSSWRRFFKFFSYLLMTVTAVTTWQMPMRKILTPFAIPFQTLIGNSLIHIPTCHVVSLTATLPFHQILGAGSLLQHHIVIVFSSYLHYILTLW